MRPHASLAAAPIVNTSEAVKTNGSDLTPGDGNALEKNADQMNPATPPVGSGSTLAAGREDASKLHKWGFEKFDHVPSVTLGIKSQPAQFNFPADARPSQRATFTDGTLQFSMRNEMTRGWFGAQSSFDFAGSTFRAEALRFGTLGNKAPQVRAPDSDRLPNCSISLEACWHILRPILKSVGQDLAYWARANSVSEDFQRNFISF